MDVPAAAAARCCPVLELRQSTLKPGQRDETVDGKGVLWRFYWMRSVHGSPRWEQAFSADGGETWETNWVMTFTPR
jgi:hypothetical protein